MAKKTEVSSQIVSLSKLKPLEFIGTGIAELDGVLAWPRRRVSMLYSNPGCGKTHIMLKSALAASQSGLKVLFIDSENRINVERVKELGGGEAKFDYSNTYINEEVGELLIKSLPKYDLVVLDSVASLIPQAEKAGEVGEAHIGLRARRNSQWLLQLDVGASNCAVVLINQMRDAIGQMYGPKHYLPGGKAMRYHSSLMVYLRSNESSDLLHQDGKKTAPEIGRKVHALITKSTVGRKNEDGSWFAVKGQETEFKILY